MMEKHTIYHFFLGLQIGQGDTPGTKIEKTEINILLSISWVEKALIFLKS